MDKNKVLGRVGTVRNKIVNFSKSVRYIAIIAVFLFSIMGSMQFGGFGVDSTGNLYVGRKTQILVYQNGECIRGLSVPVQKEGWNMGVSSDDCILLTASGKVFTLQLDGTVIREENDVNSKISRSLAKQRFVEGNDGHQYRLRHTWIWPTIEKDGSVIYRAPLWDMLLRMSFVLCFIIVIPGLHDDIITSRRKRS